MGNQEVVQDFQNATNANDLAAVRALIADDYQFSGASPEPMGVDAYVGFLTTIMGAFSDFQINLRIDNIAGNVATGDNQVSGTHDGDLDLSALGIGVISPTGKRFSLPAESVELEVSDDKVVSYHIHATEGGGVMGMLTQLGIQPPG